MGDLLATTKMMARLDNILNTPNVRDVLSGDALAAIRAEHERLMMNFDNQLKETLANVR